MERASRFQCFVGCVAFCIAGCASGSALGPSAGPVPSEPSPHGARAVHEPIVSLDWVGASDGERWTIQASATKGVTAEFKLYARVADELSVANLVSRTLGADTSTELPVALEALDLSPSPTPARIFVRAYLFDSDGKPMGEAESTSLRVPSNQLFN